MGFLKKAFYISWAVFLTVILAVVWSSVSDREFRGKALLAALFFLCAFLLLSKLLHKLEPILERFGLRGTTVFIFLFGLGLFWLSCFLGVSEAFQDVQVMRGAALSLARGGGGGPFSSAGTILPGGITT
ncbi:MAG: hypothetical protein LBQ15_05170 [Clostridium sp.]|nr:hypothetical protein [Clostridium sp.]